MVEVRAYSKIDEASRIFADPVSLSQILLKQEIIVLNKRVRLGDAIEILSKHGVEKAKENKSIYATIKESSGKWDFRILLYGSTMIACIFEPREGSSMIGGLAFNHLLKDLYPSNPPVRLNIGSLSFEHLPEALRIHVEESVKEKASAAPPHIWLNKMLYDIYIDRILTDKGAYMYVLHGKDSLGREYAVKIPREKTIDGKPLAVGTSSQGMTEVLRGIINSLEVAESTKESIGKSLVGKGYPQVLADQLVAYRKYILKPKAMIILRDYYSMEEYVTIPPIILEEYAGLGDLDGKIKKKPLTTHELAFLGLRLAGALALIHANHYVHMDIKPQNILLKEDYSEPYEYSPLIGDFVGLPHMFDTFIELKKSTPEYADPIALIKGRTSYYYDVYSLGVTLYYAATGSKLNNRILLNLLVLKYIYGATVPLRIFLVEHPDLVQKARRLEELFKKYNSGRKIPVETLISQVLSVIEEDDRKELSVLRRKVKGELARIIEKTLTLNEAERYPDAIAFWQGYLNTVERMGYTNLVPQR
jgi:serine/threonine protein kinase